MQPRARSQPSTYLDRSVVICSIRARSEARIHQDLHQKQLRQPQTGVRKGGCKIWADIVASLSQTTTPPPKHTDREAFSSPQIHLHCISFTPHCFDLYTQISTQRTHQPHYKPWAHTTQYSGKQARSCCLLTHPYTHGLHIARSTQNRPHGAYYQPNTLELADNRLRTSTIV